MTAGKPRSWRHYIVGVRHLICEQAQQSLLIARAVRAGQTTEQKDYDRWIREKERQAGAA